MKSIGSEWNRWDLHLHTASSYDYQYKSEDSDELLIKALLDNDVKAVAITDHFTIEAERICNLRQLTNDIVFFPGVELRTDKGADNVHIILIFSNEINLKELEQDFNSIMIRQKSKPDNNRNTSFDPETIYWDYNDIIDFAKCKNAIITMHAGNKTNGIDEAISNDTVHKMAIKSEYAKTVDVYEVNRKQDIIDYKNIVFKSVEERPLIICSDNHDPRGYKVREKLWLKCDLTFEGLKQCIYHPDERIYVGDVPEVLRNTRERPRNYIQYIKIDRVDKPSNENYHWFQCEIPINIGLTAIIGNKGSGKSALSDILAISGNAKTINYASFLNKHRFSKSPEKFSKDYYSEITWLDNKRTVKQNLYDIANDIEYLQYLPQQHIENLCNDLDLEFKQEIDKVIFSYLDDTGKINTGNLSELVDKKSYETSIEIKRLKDYLAEINNKIVRMEKKNTNDYRKDIKNRIIRIEEEISRHQSIKPEEITNPYENKTGEITTIENEIRDYEKSIKEHRLKLTELKEKQQEIEDLISDLGYLEKNISQFNKKVELSADKDVRVTSNIYTIKETLNRVKTDLSEAIKNIEYKLDEENPKSLNSLLKELIDSRKKLVKQSDKLEKEYYKYTEELKTWESNYELLLNNKTKLIEEDEYLDEKFNNEYHEWLNRRHEISMRIYDEKGKKVRIYEDIYREPKKEIDNILEIIDINNMQGTESFTFNPEIDLNTNNLKEDISDMINKNYSGTFSSVIKTNDYLDNLIGGTDFNNKESLNIFLENIYYAVYRDKDKAHKIMKDPERFLNYIYGLDYLDSVYNLKIGDRGLAEVSPGERGIILLIFYLALNKDNVPIIIDQPEDNLDNQSVYSNLVDCIKYAKTRRQVIIVTHNPNIAIACDAEQIIHCKLDKTQNRFIYSSGSIENPKIRNKVIDILEGTKPAFNLRKLKYDL